MNKRRVVHALLGLAIFAACAYLAIHGLESADLRRVLAEARLDLLALAALPLAVSYYARGFRWHYLFPERVRQEGMRHATGILLVGFLLNNFLPARAGELARVVLMARHNKVPASGTLATLFVERVFDGFVLGAVGLISLTAIAGAEVRWVQQLALGFGALFALVLATAFCHAQVSRLVERIAARFPGHLGHALSRGLISGIGYLGSLASVRALSRAVVFTTAVWVFEGISFALVARAFGAQLDLERVYGLLSVTNFASLAPTPGGVGAVELAGTAMLSAGGLPRESAFVIVTAQHLLQYTFCILLGGLYAGRLGFALSSRVVEPFRKLCDLEAMLSRSAPASQDIARQLRSLDSRTPALSVVVPAYNEERRILPTLLSTLEYLQQRADSFEIVVVDDGSQDATADVVHQLGLRVPELRLICLPSNMGKGAAIRAGMRSASGELILFADADGATPIAELSRLLAAIDEGADVAIGSRGLGTTEVKRTLKRLIVGRTFAFIVNSWVVPGIADTQCGFKLFRRTAAKRIFDLQQLDGFAFDVEVLRLANALDFRTREVAVRWADQPGSAVNLVTDSLRMLWDVVRVPYLPSVARATGALPANEGEPVRDGG